MKEFHISKKEENQRIDKYVRKILDEAPLSFIYKVFRKKDVKVNGHWVNISYVLKENDLIRIYITDEQLNEFSKPKTLVNSKLLAKIIFEDDNILVLNKPKGILVHGDETEKRVTLANQVLNYLYQKGEYDPACKGFMPSPAHRLDRNTSGVVIFGKNLPALQVLEVLFKEKSGIAKHYLGLVSGIIEDDGEINAPLLKDPNSGLVKVSALRSGAKDALTRYHVVETIKDYSLLDVQIFTGRTHQIRVHMAYMHHPIVGDGKYGDFKVNRFFKEKYKLNSQFLHANEITFKNVPTPLDYLNGKSFRAELPKDFDDIIKDLKIL